MVPWSILAALFLSIASTFSNSALSARTTDGEVDPAQTLIEAKLLEPLEKKEAERSRFSRAALPPQTRRIRILEKVPQSDAKGRAFLPFAIDETHSLGSGAEVPEGSWSKNTITGCVYLGSEDVMVRRGEVYYASSVLLGVPTPIAPAETCRR